MSSTDGWPEHITLPGPPAHLHAVGALALIFSRLEMGLYGFLREYFGDQTEACMQVFGSLNNRGRVDLIKTMASEKESGPVTDAVHFAMRCFDICAESRNLVLHAFTHRHDEESIVLLKRTTDNSHLLKPYRFTLKEMRAAVVSSAEVLEYSIQLTAWLRLRNMKPAVSRPLPDRPAQPRTLSLSALPPDQLNG